MTGPNLTITEQQAETAGRQMMVDHFTLLISTCWESWPVGWRRSILKVACFSDKEVDSMFCKDWDDFNQVNKNLVSNGIIRIFQVTDFVRGALI